MYIEDGEDDGQINQMKKDGVSEDLFDQVKQGASNAGWEKPPLSSQDGVSTIEGKLWGCPTPQCKSFHSWARSPIRLDVEVLIILASQSIEHAHATSGRA